VEHQSTIEVIVNGKSQQVAAGAMVTDLISTLNLAPERIAIELNHSILPRGVWARTALSAGDQLEIVHFVGGG
jgi:sulfur carrier protein